MRVISSGLATLVVMAVTTAPLAPLAAEIACKPGTVCPLPPIAKIDRRHTEAGVTIHMTSYPIIAEHPSGSGTPD